MQIDHNSDHISEFHYHSSFYVYQWSARNASMEKSGKNMLEFNDAARSPKSFVM
jgi:hypothetical protein